jgi:hypothetical protein
MDPAGSSLTQAQIEAAVRSYLARVGRRYVPLAIGVIVLAIVAITVPTTEARKQPSQALNGLGTTTTGPTAGGTGSGAGAPAIGGISGAPASQGAAGGATSSSGAVAGGGGAGSAAGNGGAVPAGPVAPSASGIARTGVHCGPGKKQMTWSVYAPPCVARYTGNNGGATARGVTATTITLSYRISTSADDAAISAATGSAAPPKDTDFIADLNTYIGYFNDQFELYGRKVVIKSYNGTGDYIQEDQGQGGAQAQSDAATAHKLNAFGDVSFQLRGSNLYWSALAQQGIVAWGPLGFPTSYYQRYAPYWYSYTPSGSTVAGFFGNITCQRLAGMDAIFAPDVTYQKTNRVFGLIHPNNPEYVAIAGDIKKRLKSCGVGIAREQEYSINVAQYQTEATNMVAQMRAKGVTTVLCYCDPVVPIFLGNAAQSQGYNPEWVQPYWGDPQARQPEGGRWGGVISDAVQWPDQAHNEAYRVFKLASHGAEPKEKYYAAAYAEIMQVFIGLQSAGPTLTPQNMLRGYASLPDSGDGQAGTWTYKGGFVFTPQTTTTVGWYDPSYTSKFDGAAGGYQLCDSGKVFSFDDPRTWGGPRQQLHCFGK